MSAISAISPQKLPKINYPLGENSPNLVTLQEKENVSHLNPRALCEERCRRITRRAEKTKKRDRRSHAMDEGLRIATSSALKRYFEK
jgi:hypothetical protein